MSKKKKLIPELRFPEFKTDGVWLEEPLESLAKRITKKNKDCKIDLVFTNSASEGIVNQRDYFDKDIANKHNLVNYYIVENGDFIYNPRISSEAPVGPVSKNKTSLTGVMSPLYTVFRFNDKRNSFYEYYFNTSHWYKAIRKVSNTGARFDRISISDSVFMKIPVLCPKPQERQKIAACLISLDELITNHNDKLKALEDHKKGLMQNLFPQEGQSMPNYRFPEFRNDEDWEQTTIGEMGSFYYGKSAPKWSLSENAKTLCVRYGELYSKFGTVIKQILSKTSIDPKTLRFSKGGEILIPRVGEDPYAFANCSYLPFPNIAIGEMISVYETNEDSLFFAYYFNTLSKQFARVVEGQNVKNLYYVNLEPIEIMKPVQILEQQKIASCLSAIDDLIDNQTEKIKQLELHKKGLIQGLFPKIES